MDVYFTILTVDIGDKWQYTTSDDRLRIFLKLGDSGKANNIVDISGCEESLRRFVKNQTRPLKTKTNIQMAPLRLDT